MTYGNNSCDIASDILKKVFINSESNEHFLSSIDDRYWCHYIGTSIFRALKIIPNSFKSCEFKFTERSFEHFNMSGYLLIKNKGNNIIISTKKGGILSVFSNEKSFSDFGWHFIYKNKEPVNNFWSNNGKATLKKMIKLLRSIFMVFCMKTNQLKAAL